MRAWTVRGAVGVVPHFCAIIDKFGAPRANL